MDSTAPDTPHEVDGVHGHARERSEPPAAAILAAIIESSFDAIISKSLDGLITSWNAAAEQMFGFQADEIIGQSVLRLIPSDRRAEEDRILALLRQGKRVPPYQTERMTKDGRHLNVSLTVSPIRDSSGAIIGASKIIHDITATKLAEKALAESEGRFRALFDHTTVFLGLLEPDGTIIDTNSAALRSCNKPRAEVIGLKIWDAPWWEGVPDLQRDLKIDCDLVAAGETISRDTRFISKDGTGFVRRTLSPIRNQRGQIVMIVAEGQDLTDRRRSEIALRDSEAKLKIGVEIAGIGLGIVNYRDGTIVLDAAAAALFALPSDQPLSRDEVHGRFAARSLPALKQAIAQATDPAGSGFLALEHAVVLPDGTERWLSARKQVFFASDGGDGVSRPVSALLALRDITDRKRSESRINDLMNEVNHRSKNLLGVVQAVARHTARNADPATFVNALSARIAGLAASQDLLIRNAWRGVEIDDLVRAQLGHFSEMFDRRILIGGPRYRLSAPAAQSIGMTIYELGTNAVKYGALSNETGKVQISWGIDAAEAAIWMQWQEEGGPPVSPPARKGFGQTVVLGIVESAVKGKASIDYRPEGLVWKLRAPIERTIESHAQS